MRVSRKARDSCGSVHASLELTQSNPESEFTVLRGSGGCVLSVGVGHSFTS